MAKQVREIMNPELISVEPDAGRLDALDMLIAFEVTACPVMDEAGKLMGMVRIRDLFDEGSGGRVRDCLGEPAVTVAQDATIEEAAKKLSEHRTHRMVAIDEKGRAVGMVSATDLVSALAGLPVHHPTTFSNEDADGIGWSGDEPFDNEHSSTAPDGAGVLVLVRGGRGRVEVPVWAEAAQNLRARLDALLSIPVDDAQLERVLDHDRDQLRFRFTEIDDAGARDDLVDVMRRRMAPIRKPA